MQNKFFLLIGLVSGLLITSNNFAMDKGKEPEERAFLADVIDTIDGTDALLNHKMELLKELKAGQKALLLEQYISNTDFKDLIKEKHSQGVMIEVITNPTHKHNKAIAQELAMAGVPVWVANTHAKTSLFEDIVVLGSENASDNFGKHNECGIRTKDLTEKWRTLYEAIKHQASRLSSRDGEVIPHSPVAKSALITPPLTPTSPTLFSSAAHSLESLVANMIKKPIPAGYNQKIYLSTMTLGDKVAAAIKDKAREAEITVVLDSSAQRHMSKLKRAGAEVVIPQDRLHHSKLALVKNIPTTPSRKKICMALVSTGNFTRDTQTNMALVVPDNSPLNEQVERVITSFRSRRVLFTESGKSISSTSSALIKEKSDVGEKE